MSLAHFRRTKPTSLQWLKASDANALSAEFVANVLGVGIKPQGRHCELSDGIRGTCKEGRMVWCTQDGHGIGDNLALAQHLTGLDFRPALELLLGQPANVATKQVQAPNRRIFRLPRGNATDRLHGRAYLVQRGIALSVIAYAEDSGMLSYIPGAVLFIGYDKDRPMSATRRGFLSSDPHPKRDLKGSDKSFPAILAGHGDTVWVVEGGVDALALQMMEPSRPTVIVSGGAGCRGWVDTSHIAAILSDASKVVVACDNENTIEKQTYTDSQHQHQASLIQRYCSNVTNWHPPLDYKDLGEMACAWAIGPASPA